MENKELDSYLSFMLHYFQTAIKTSGPEELHTLQCSVHLTRTNQKYHNNTH